MRDVLVIRSVSRPGRSAVHLDPIEAQIVAGKWRAPQLGAGVSGSANSEQHWESATADDRGILKGSVARGGYVYWPVASGREQIMLLEAAGHGCVYVNGEIRGGDSYGFGYLRLPVALHAGTNDFLFQSGRGEFRAKLIASPEALSIHTADSTLPDVLLGENEPLWGATVLINATRDFMRASLRVVEVGSSAQTCVIPPLGICKAPFLISPMQSLLSNRLAVTLEAIDLNHQDTRPAKAEIELRVRRSEQSHTRTFISDIDGSVQYYAVQPAMAAEKETAGAALFLSLHGAGVEARGQSEAYEAKAAGPIVCPTNRRPYGFDWEEWGRADAMEVLDLATARYRPDPQRVYLTGHSMGGHGTWQLGALYPDRFAAIGPSAGWISFTSYANSNRLSGINAVQQMLQRAAASSDTLQMGTNYLQLGIYILHGDADDNVPPREAREMRRFLGEFHRDFDSYEQRGAGHWWDASDEPGADCVDWAPMFDFFASHRIPSDREIRRVRFITVNPAVASRSHWVTILGQERALEPSLVDVRCDPGKRRIVGLTTNVSRLQLRFPTIPAGSGLTIELDGQTIADLILGDPTNSTSLASLCLVRKGSDWKVGEYPSADLKRPERSGPFREAFRRHAILVYGSKGTAEENAWTLAKARYDAETFYYRGNGSFEIVADTDVIGHEGTLRNDPASRGRSRNLILYGNKEINAAWAALLGGSPVQVQRGRLQMGDHEWTGEDVGCLFVQPHPRDPNALIAGVGGTGLSGAWATERMPYFVSGAGFPDCLVLGADLPTEGFKAVRAAGFFGEDWQVASGEFVWGP